MTGATSQIDPIRQMALKWYYQELWGPDFGDIDEIGVEEFKEAQIIFLKSLLVAANGDGKVTPKERQWVIGRGAVAGVPESILKELENYPADEDITELIARTVPNQKSGRGVIYFAINAAASDGEYNEGEKATIRKVAQALGISEEVVQEIENLYLEEQRVKEKRIALCLPDGSPFE
ncbi:TerB family tellurite resistance protein [Microseira wollei]|uniref:Co-chaperone DjlA N-terminal domain-containing protein n=1 Tax=Microseira wollei NIES-4236 TaxID=2530354 RepID=A0AAV3XME7_9CYAN|nr:TerB family tellurite resistance protein [Microseira wollei]GET43654.1 hypothetical protein MiSe_84790 [Microseira wollei NIES-4236]